jgi:hypothetical protein
VELLSVYLAMQAATQCRASRHTMFTEWRSGKGNKVFHALRLPEYDEGERHSFQIFPQTMWTCSIFPDHDTGASPHPTKAKGNNNLLCHQRALAPWPHMRQAQDFSQKNL